MLSINPILKVVLVIKKSVIVKKIGYKKIRCKKVNGLWFMIYDLVIKIQL